jgi:hypothetical protein
MSAPALVQGAEPFAAPVLPSFPRMIPFGLSPAEFAWCLDPNGHPMVLLPSALIDPWFELEYADRNQKPALSLKAIALLASELGLEVPVTKKTYTFWGQYNEQIPSSTSHPWTPAREWSVIQRFRKLVRKEKYDHSHEEVADESEFMAKGAGFSFHTPDPPKPNPKKEQRKEELKQELRDRSEAGQAFTEEESILYVGFLEDDTAADVGYFLGKGKEAMKKKFQRLVKPKITDEVFLKALYKLYPDAVSKGVEGWHILIKLPQSAPYFVRLDAAEDATEEQLEEAIASSAKEETIRFSVDRLVKDGKVRSSFEPGDENSFGPMTPEGKERCRPLWAKVRQAFKDGDVHYLWFHEEEEAWPSATDPVNTPMLLK